MYGYIYLIVNKLNGKTYIGQRKYRNNLSWSEDLYMGSGKLIKQAELKYDIGNFDKFLIQNCESKEVLDKQERFWIAEYRSRGKAEYNIASGGYNSGMIGRHHTEESKRKIAESNSRAKKGKPMWPNGRVFTEEWKKHISESKKGCKGFTKHHSEETKELLSERNKGRKFWTNGEINTTSFECPGEGWYLGRVGNYHANKGSFGYKERG